MDENARDYNSLSGAVVQRADFSSTETDSIGLHEDDSHSSVVIEMSERAGINALSDMV